MRILRSRQIGPGLRLLQARWSNRQDKSGRSTLNFSDIPLLILAYVNSSLVLTPTCGRGPSKTAEQMRDHTVSTMNSHWVLLLAACFAVSVHSQTVPAPAVATPLLYQRPNNSDCVASTSSSTNYFPLQFQIAGASATEEDRVNVR